MCDSRKNDKEQIGDGKMSAIAKPKPVRSTEIKFDTNEQYNEFLKYIKNPPATSDFVKELIKEYKKQSRDGK